MPHRRAHSYFSGLTVISAPFQAVSKASSTDELRELQLDPYKRTYSTTLSKSTDHLEVCKQRIEEELDSEVQDLLSRPPKYKEVVPTSIKFAVSKPSTSPSTMARPRSPSKASNTDMLDQTLLRIRKRLTALSSDRVDMESKMEELISGIRTVHLQCQQQQQLQLQSPVHSDLSSIRRVRSSTTPNKRPSNLSITRNDVSYANSSCSQEYLANTSFLSQDTLSQSSQCLSSQPVMRQRSESASTTYKYKPHKPPTLSFQNAGSYNSVEEFSVPTTTIQELPESPKFVSCASLFDCSASPSEYSIYGTTPRSRYTRSFSASSPPSSHRSPSSQGQRYDLSMVTSTPNINIAHPEGEPYHTLPSKHSADKSPLPVMTTVIPEDEVDNRSVTDSLSQHSQLSANEEGSPKNGSSIIVRRSSLTGQIEHYRRPRAHSLAVGKKKNSISKDLGKTFSNYECRLTTPTPTPPGSLGGSNSSQFRVLNKGVKKYSSKRRSARLSQVILPSVETTV